jgi:hypothetical protein
LKQIEIKQKTMDNSKQHEAEKAVEEGDIQKLNKLALKYIYPRYYLLEMSEQGLEWIRNMDKLRETADSYMGKGNINGLRELASKGAYPTITGIYNAIKAGKLEPLLWMENQLGNNMPLPYSTDDAAENNHMNIIEWYFRRGVTPGINGASKAAYRGHEHIIRWMVENGQKDDVTGCCSLIAYNAAAGGQKQLLKYLTSPPLNMKLQSDMEGVAKNSKGELYII